ncbi:hypothetical protein [Mesorhizobium sp. M1A.F.Ca.IN.020.03.2.1]|uniref:hypothetical protein n=1 Tax=Mesorhizobium sp. M1A.F.Ca.IN.020.03.2.1 TaxID=2496769 RepID=UPI0013E2AE57|nr:hypothetical protein [Mesorhizobium sp. M1A.F.Ca.IN.020.03.2.1]
MALIARPGTTTGVIDVLTGCPRIPAATGLALVTTTPAPPVTDEGNVTDFLLFNGMEVAVIPDHRSERQILSQRRARAGVRR